jgi:putative ABC transport system ATP-binding protein
MENESSRARSGIRLENVAKSYLEGGGERVVFRNLTSGFAPGEVSAVVGRSGTGKSTLLNILSGIDLPDAGIVDIHGSVLTGMSDYERTVFRRRNVGFVFQSFNLIPTLTVEENLLLPLELLSTPMSDARERAAGFLERVGLGNRAGSFPDRLSGGEQQRVAIARALVHEPVLILADEPTGNLDRETGLDVLNWLITLTRESHRTLLIVTHSEEVMARADHVLTLEDGQLHSVCNVVR